MRHDFLDRYSRLNSPIHRLPAAVKLISALALVVVILLLPPSWPMLLGGLAVFLLAVAGLSRIPWRFLLRRVLLLEPFVLGVALLSLFQPDGWRLFLFLVAKCTLCLLAMLLLANTTPFSDLLRVFKAARVPSLLVTTLALMYRYLFVLVDEAQRMKRARLSRTFSIGRTRSWRTLATGLSQLFIRTSERAERIYAAMCARGWQ
jgi:cobalt/nickel transport system permease protein